MDEKFGLNANNLWIEDYSDYLLASWYVERDEWYSPTGGTPDSMRTVSGLSRNCAEAVWQGAVPPDLAGQQDLEAELIAELEREIGPADWSVECLDGEPLVYDEGQRPGWCRLQVELVAAIASGQGLVYEVELKDSNKVQSLLEQDGEELVEAVFRLQKYEDLFDFAAHTRTDEPGIQTFTAEIEFTNTDGRWHVEKILKIFRPNPL